jgi:inner membrane transporter RhtA
VTMRGMGSAHPSPAPVGLVLGAVVSLQVGAAFAKGLFDELGAAGTVWLRLAVAAVVLLAAWRPRVRALGSRQLGVAAVFGLTLAAMNLCIYEAMARMPIGLAVTLEFVGPLGVAVAGSRRPLDLAWVGLAGAGVVALSGGGSDLDPAGVAFALAAGGFWAGYILLGARVGRAIPGGGGLALAMGVGAVAVAPIGLPSGGAALLDPGLLAAGAAVALLSSIVPYSLELEALRRLPARTFGVLMSLEPAVAALAGFALLGEGLSTLEVAAVGMVVAASAGSALGSGGGPGGPLPPAASSG